MDAVKCQEAAIGTFPHPLPIGVFVLEFTSDLVYELRIRHCDLYVWILLISLESVQVLSHNQLDGMYRGLMLGNLSFEVGLESIAVMGREGYRGSNIQVMKEIRDVKHHRVASLNLLSKWRDGRCMDLLQ